MVLSKPTRNTNGTEGPGCVGCPAYEWGPSEWCPDDSTPPGCEVEVWAQNPGQNEVTGERITHYEGSAAVLERCDPAPLIGATGYVLGRRYLPLAGLERGHNVRCGNVLRCRQGDPRTGKGTNNLPPLRSQLVRDAIRHCQRAHYKPTGARIIVTLGEYALWAATGQTSVEGWRGWALPYVGQEAPPIRAIWTPRYTDRVVLAHYHPAFVFRAPWEEPTVEADWRKVRRVLNGTWPRPLPEIERRPPTVWPLVSGFDTEFYPHNRKLIRWSMAHLEEHNTMRVYVVEAAWGQPRMAWPPVPVVYSHNFVADLPFYWDLGATEPSELHDTMYMHHVLYSDLAHTLDYVGSIYQSINRHKHLEHVNFIEYSAGDAVSTLDCGLEMERELLRDPQSRRVYLDCLLPNLPMLSRYERGPGYALNRQKVKQALAALNRVKDAASVRAQAAAGWPLKLSSPKQVAHQLFRVERKTPTHLS